MVQKEPAKNAPSYAACQAGLCAFTIGAQVSRSRIVTVQLQDDNGNNCQKSTVVKAYLASAVSGLTLASAPDGHTVINAKGLLLAQVTDLVFGVVSDTSGVFDLNITHSVTANYYLVVCFPDGHIQVSPVIALS